jgi:hypothetical protein
MDIEGGEYEVIEDILESRISVGQVLVEFHHNFRSVSITRTANAVHRLNERGYRIFHLSPRGYEPSMERARPGRIMTRQLSAADHQSG